MVNASSTILHHSYHLLINSSPTPLHIYLLCAIPKIIFQQISCFSHYQLAISSDHSHVPFIDTPSIYYSHKNTIFFFSYYCYLPSQELTILLHRLNMITYQDSTTTPFQLKSSTQTIIIFKVNLTFRITVSLRLVSSITPTNFQNIHILVFFLGILLGHLSQSHMDYQLQDRKNIFLRR